MAVPAASRAELVPSRFRALPLLPCNLGSLAPNHMCAGSLASGTMPPHSRHVKRLLVVLLIESRLPDSVRDTSTRARGHLPGARSAAAVVVLCR